MSKIKKIEIINIIVISILALVDLVLGIIFKLDRRFFFSSCITVGVIGVVNLIFIAIKEASVLEYTAKKYTMICLALHAILSVAIFFVFEKIDGYDLYKLIYWIGLILIIIVPIAVMHFGNQKQDKKPDNNGPKFIVNK